MLTASSSVVAFQNAHNGKATFAAASKAWLKPLLADPQFTDGEMRVCVAIYLGFNSNHYQETGQLLSWPSWLTLQGETTKSESTVERSLEKLERLGALQILRGGFDPKTGQRRPNKYLTSHPSGVTGGHPVREEVHPSNPPVTGDGRLGEGLGEKKERIKIGNSRKQGKESKEASKPSEDLPSPSEAPSLSKTPHPPSSARPPSPRDRWRREKAEDEANLEHYRARALATQNGGGS